MSGAHRPEQCSDLIAALLTTLLAASAVLFGAGGAEAAGYRYWSFWEANGKDWAYATQGPALLRPDDGTVQGFRFSVSEDSADADQPRRAPTSGRSALTPRRRTVPSGSPW